MMATSMSANVFFWIIPGQRKVIAQLKAEPAGHPIHGQRAKQRSVHNTYFTLPVLIAMLSNHYGFLCGAPNNWLVLVAIMLAGALIRHSFVARHKALVREQARAVELRRGRHLDHRRPGGLAHARAAAPKVAAGPPVTYAQLRQVLDTRCVLCHNEQLQSKNVALHARGRGQERTQMMYQQAVVLKTMPLNNATQITDAGAR